MSPYQLSVLQGEELRPFMQVLAELRVKVFREFPYLYDGDLSYERDYLEKLLSSEHSRVITVSLGERIVGASTSLPLVDADQAFQALFEDPSEWFYFGESVILQEHRGQGLGKKFFHTRELEAQRLGFSKTCFCGVLRPSEHPARPPGYRDLSEFWQNLGYQRMEQMIVKFAWKDLGHVEESEKPMQFWTKILS